MKREGCKIRAEGREWNGLREEKERKRGEPRQSSERREEEEEEEISLGALTTRVQYSHPYRAESPALLPCLRTRHTFPPSNTRTPT